MRVYAILFLISISALAQEGKDRVVVTKNPDKCKGESCREPIDIDKALKKERVLKNSRKYHDGQIPNEGSDSSIPSEGRNKEGDSSILPQDRVLKIINPAASCTDGSCIEQSPNSKEKVVEKGAVIDNFWNQTTKGNLSPIYTDDETAFGKERSHKTSSQQSDLEKIVKALDKFLNDQQMAEFIKLNPNLGMAEFIKLNPNLGLGNYPLVHIDKSIVSDVGGGIPPITDSAVSKGQESDIDPALIGCKLTQDIVECPADGREYKLTKSGNQLLKGVGGKEQYVPRQIYPGDKRPSKPKPQVTEQ